MAAARYKKIKPSVRKQRAYAEAYEVESEPTLSVMSLLQNTPSNIKVNPQIPSTQPQSNPTAVNNSVSYPVIYPLPIGNGCVGQNSDGSVWREQKCVTGYDVTGNKIYSCTTMLYFYAQCEAGTILQCNPLSGGYVAANTVCNQKLFSVG